MEDIKYTAKCPKCGSEHINQYRMMTGAIWCNDCGYRVEHKERDKSFYVEITPDPTPPWQGRG